MHGRPIPRVHHTRTGRVWIRDFDLGMTTSLGGTLQDISNKRRYVVDIATLPAGDRLVPVTFVNPEVDRKSVV